MPQKCIYLLHSLHSFISELLSFELPRYERGIGFSAGTPVVYRTVISLWWFREMLFSFMELAITLE